MKPLRTAKPCVNAFVNSSLVTGVMDGLVGMFFTFWHLAVRSYLDTSSTLWTVLRYLFMSKACGYNQEEQP